MARQTNSKRALTMQELEEIVSEPDFYIDEDSQNLDIVILPPDPEYVTDEDEAEDDQLGIAEINDVPGELEVGIGNEDRDMVDISEVQSTSAIPSVQVGAKKQRLSNLVPKWKKCDPKYTFPDADFAASEKCKIEMLKKEYGALTPVQLFEMFISSDILEYIKEETLRYAHHTKNDVSFALDIDDLKCFIGILLFSGYHQVPSEKMYWSTDDDLGVPIVQSGMSRNKYSKIKSMLHFADNDKLDKADRAYKLRPLIEKINLKFQQFGIFTSHLSIDEMIVKYYGHHGLKQFIRGKPIRFGYKLWALCASNGYCYKFIFYTGKETNKQLGLTLGSRVVTELLSCVPASSEHAVFFGNFFTNRDLLVHLKNIGFRATGTVRDNRTDKCPMKSAKELAKESRGSFDYRYDTVSEVLMVRWHDNKCVIVATNYDKIQPLAKVALWKREVRQKVELPQPRLIKNYNTYIGGVDHHDWLVRKYSIQIRGKKWYWPMFIRILDMALTNAWILYRSMHGRNTLSCLEFRRAIAVTYMKLTSCARKTTKAAVTSEDVRFDGRNHFIQFRDSQRRCQQKDCKGRPKSYCLKCNVTLCANCFLPYHQN